MSIRRVPPISQSAVGVGDNHKGLLRLPQQLRELRDVGGDAASARILPVVGLNLLAGGAGHGLVGINRENPFDTNTAKPPDLIRKPTA
jgi:hypothetical protein